MDDRQNELLGRGTVQTVLAHRNHRGIPRDVAAREVLEKTKGGHFVLIARLNLHLGFALIDVSEHPINGVTRLVRTQQLVIRHPNHPLGRHARSGHRGKVVAGLVAVGRPRLLGRGEGVKGLVHPVTQHRFEGRLDLVVRKILEMIDLRLAVVLIEATGEQVDVAVVVNRANH